jgi:hypothetical protein
MGCAFLIRSQIPFVLGTGFASKEVRSKGGTNGSSGSSAQAPQEGKVHQILPLLNNQELTKLMKLLIIGLLGNKITEGVQGLRKAREALQNTLKNPNLDPVTKVAIQSRINTATQLVERAEQLLEPIP